MILIRAYLFAGLVAHKLVWERLKRHQRSTSAKAAMGDAPLRVRAAKLAKMLVLGGILLQTLTPWYWLPIAADPQGLLAAGVAIYTMGLAVAIAGRVQLGGNWSDIEAAQVLSHQTVVNHGLYRYVRHPIYVGDLLLLAGLELALNSWLVLGVIVLAPVVLSRAVREEELLKQSLTGYREYCKTSKRFIPFVV
ncbi:MAG TPA: isoprenylcysteine carboxylmethyltransferase family protein [Vicinamibacterales bacterium]|nr:isoprenylcysteine carboxylmethyltransferase family protein [Vicinamibacterales bacterium]